MCRERGRSTLRSLRFTVSLVVGMTTASIAHSQQLLWQTNAGYPAPQAAPGSAYYVEDSLGDVNGDGLLDLLAYDPYAPNGSMGNAGYVAVLSGVNGSVIHASYGAATNTVLQVVGVVGDVTGDGISDYVVQGAVIGVQLRSGATGLVVSTLPGLEARDACRIGDVNGDGFGDFALGFGAGPPPPIPGAGIATVYLGPTGSTVAYHVYGLNSIDAFGWDTAPLGDVNGDGVPDFIVGAPGPFQSKFLNFPGWAYVVSGADGSFIHAFTGPTNLVRPAFGRLVSGLGDIDLDGVPDILIGAPGIPGFFVYSGASGALLFTDSAPWAGTLANTLGLHGRGLRDVDGDGVPDFAVQGQWGVGNQATIPAATLVYSGATFNVLYTIDNLIPEPPYYGYGYGFDCLGDVNGDGFERFAVSAISATAGAPSQIVAVSLRPAGVSSFGSGCPGDLGVVPRIGVHPAAIPGAAMKLHVSETAPGRGAALAVGLSNTTFLGTSLPWYPWPVSAPLCGLLVSIDGLAATVTTPSSGMRGAASHAFTIPTMPSLTGLTFYAQWGVDSIPGFVPPIAMTRGLAITIQ
jgi:hypothetical protein